MSAAFSATILGRAVLPHETEAAEKLGKKRRRCRKKANRTWCGKKCVRGTCCPGDECGSGNCVCVRAVEGDAFCAVNVLISCEETCETSTNCLISRRCIPVGNECKVCVLECGD